MHRLHRGLLTRVQPTNEIHVKKNTPAWSGYAGGDLACGLQQAPVDASVVRQCMTILKGVGAAGMHECSSYIMATHCIEHNIYQATRDEAVKAGFLIMKALAEEYVQGKCTKEDLKPKKKEQFKSLVTLAKRSPPTSATKKRPAAGAAAGAAATMPSVKKPAAGAAAGAAARPAARSVPVAKKPAAGGAAEVAAATAAAAAAPRTSSRHVPAAATRRTAAEADGEEEEEEEEESEEVVPYVQLYMFSQSDALCMCVFG